LTLTVTADANADAEIFRIGCRARPAVRDD
jgi:hypothetical protein